MKTLYVIILSLLLPLLLEVLFCKEEDRQQANIKTVEKDAGGYINLWVNYADKEKTQPVIKIGGHEISSLTIVVSSICALLEDKDPKECNIPLEIAELGAYNETLGGVPIDLLKLLDNEPVFLSKLSIPLGSYQEIQLYTVPDNNFIIIDGETHPLKLLGNKHILKLYGKFKLEQFGQMFSLYFDFVTSEMLWFVPGIGYSLRPVILMKQTQLENGYYKGTFIDLEVIAYFDFQNKKIRVKTKLDPRVELSGSFTYNAEKQHFIAYFKQIKCKGCGPFNMDIERTYNDHLPLEVSEWSNDKLVFETKPISTLVRTSSDTIPVPPPAYFQTTLLGFPPSLQGKYMVALFKPTNIPYPVPPLLAYATIAESTTLSINIPDSYFQSIDELKGQFCFACFDAYPQEIIIFPDDSMHKYGLNTTGSLFTKCGPWKVSKGKVASTEYVASIPFDLKASPNDITSPITLSWNSVVDAKKYFIQVYALQETPIIEVLVEGLNYTFSDEEFRTYKAFVDAGNELTICVTALSIYYVINYTERSHPVFLGSIVWDIITIK